MQKVRELMKRGVSEVDAQKIYNNGFLSGYSQALELRTILEERDNCWKLLRRIHSELDEILETSVDGQIRREYVWSLLEIIREGFPDDSDDA